MEFYLLNSSCVCVCVCEVACVWVVLYFILFLRLNILFESIKHRRAHGILLLMHFFAHGIMSLCHEANALRIGLLTTLCHVQGSALTTICHAHDENDKHYIHTPVHVVNLEQYSLIHPCLCYHTYMYTGNNFPLQL